MTVADLNVNPLDINMTHHPTSRCTLQPRSRSNLLLELRAIHISCPRIRPTDFSPFVPLSE